MKKRLIKYLLLIIPFGFFSSKLLAQAPVAPGEDPMKADSAKYIIVFQPASNNQSTSFPNFLPERKDPVFINNKSDTLYLGENDKEEIHSIF